MVVSLKLLAIVAAAAALLLPTAAAAGQEQADPPPTVLAMTVNDTDRMTLAVRIGERGPYSFVLDTAATRTVIARDLAAQLALKPAGRSRMLSLTGSSEVSQVHVPGLAYRPGRLLDVRAIAIAGDHIGGHGILGLDTLKNQRVVMDFATRTLSVTEAPRRRLREGDDPQTIVVEARRRLGQLILAESSIDGEKIDVIVDTGTQVSLGNEALRRRLIGRGRKYEVTPIALQGVTGGTLAADYTRVDRVRIGRAQLIGMPIAFADAYPFRKLKLRKPALLLGMDALRMFERVTVDFSNRQASFVLPETASRDGG